MATKKSKKNIYFFILLTIIGCVIACSSIITNDYLKLVIVMVSLCVGLFGIMKSLSNPSSGEDPKEK
ncbi:MAG: hypothetical protein LBH58_02265 [Tannerellaceae bacterium]|jgi:predicted membrane channel-forming protein YqfA (hemolysin III family)|nr:hypothetical protein [Tannerellaceae bacterium]